MAITVELWLAYIMDRLYKDNAFLEKSFNEDSYVIAGRIVHIPQPGAAPTKTKNRSVYPATALRRADNDIIYALDEYSTDPTHITNADIVEATFDKIHSVLGDHAAALTEMIADDTVIKWLSGIPTNRIIATTGASAAGTLAGQTGTRKVLTAKELQNAKLLLNKQNIPKVDRYALLDEDMADQLFSSLTDTQYRDFSQYADMKNGVVGRIHGFDIYTRSTVGAATSAGVINPYGAAVGATDNAVSMCWQKDAVTKAIGEQKFFENIDDALYQGDVYSALVRGGGRRRRAGDEGVVVIAAAA